MTTKKTVFVGLSGGVDSAVAAKRLLDQGYNVVGVFIKVWHPDFMVCNWEAERLDAMRVAAHLGIPFLTCDAEARYRDEVAHYFIAEYKAGRTPNPDVMCNKHVKFGAFLEFAREHGADSIATGHYVQKTLEGNQAVLRRGSDGAKDQSYFLWTLTPEQLAFSLFPIGDTSKYEIREEAEAAGLPVFAKKDSQGICFLGHVDIKDFLGHYIDLCPGDVLDEQGKVVGKHEGAFVYTLGQRHGFTIVTTGTSSTPHYVVGRDIVHNTITVAAEPLTSTVATKGYVLHDLVLRTPVVVGDTLEAQVRYRQQPFKVEVVEHSDTTLTVRPLTHTELASAGQSCVLYAGGTCIGGGIIS